MKSISYNFKNQRTFCKIQFSAKILFKTLFLDATNGILQCCSSSNTSLSSIQSDLRKGQRRPSQRPKKVLIENAVYNEPTAAAEEITSNSPVRKLTTNNLR